MSFDSLLNTTCTIQSKTTAQDSAGQEIETWATAVSSVPCRIDPRGEERHEVPTAIWASATNTLFLRNPSTITLSVKTHRIYIGSQYFEILWIPQYYGSSELDHLELYLKAVDNE